MIASTSEIPTKSWQTLEDSFKNGSQQLFFTNAQIINYFVVRTAADGLPTFHLKSMNESALNLF